MTQYVLIASTDTDPLAYSVDTAEGLAVAAAAIAEAGLGSARVWVTPTDEHSPDAYETGVVVWAAEDTD